ncbi:MAG: ABC transporter ATPase [Flavobacteriaceae bacterium]|nr:ABC transporter ATPase [Flavobacteriaceae bacterium]
MFVNFDSLADSSKVWIYQSSREFTAKEVDEIEVVLRNFVSTWKRHSKDLRSSFQIKYNQFVILAIDESYNNFSGCSIDASTNIFKNIEEKYNVDMFNKMNTAFKNGEHINIVTLSDFQKYIKENKINNKTIVFNNMITTKKELDNRWELAAEDSWHSRYF